MEKARFKTALLRLIRRRSFIITATVTGLLSLLCLVRILMPNRVFTFEGAGSFLVGVEGAESIPVFENVTLAPGLYHMEMAYSTDTDAISTCTAEDAHVFPGALLVNFDTLYINRSRTDFYMWLFESTDTLTVSVKLAPGSTLMTGDLTVVETNGLWTMLLTVILFCGLCVMGGLLFKVWQELYGVSVKTKSVFLMMVVITLLSSTSFLLDGINLGADLGYHYHRIEAVWAGMISGQFPVRIAPRWLYGQGYADPVFYCNLLLIFPALLRLLGFPLNASYQIFAVAMNAAAAGVAYYSFSRIFKNYKIGICCSGLYTLSAIHLYKFIVTGALGEGTAQIFLPLILLGLYETFASSEQDGMRPNTWICLALGYAGLFQTHVLTTEVTILVTLMFCLVYIRRLFVKEVFCTLLKGAAGAVALSLWYLVPFLDYYLTQDVHIRHVSARTIQGQGADPGLLLRLFERMPATSVFPKDGMQDAYPAGIGAMLAAGVGFFLILWFSGKLKEKNPLRRFIKISAVFAVILMLFSLKAFPWDRLQAISSLTASLISSLQFPNRFLSWATCLAIAVMGYCILNRRAYFGRAGNYLVLGIMLLTVFSASFLLEDLNKRYQRFYVYSEEGMNFGYLSGAEYLVQGTEETLLTFDIPHPSEGVSVCDYTNEKLHITARCTNDGQEQGYVDMPLLLYKGYRAWNTDTGERLEITHNANHQLRVLLPAYFSGNIEIKFVSPFYWRAAEIVSLMMLICLAVRPLGRRLWASGRLPLYGRRHHER